MEEFIPDNLNVENVLISSIKPYKNNPKIHNTKQVQQIMNSITEFKFTSPILIDENNEILAGHGRLLAAQKLGIKEIPTIKLPYHTEAQKKAYRIADNKLTENGKWDFDLLKIEFQDIENLNLNLDLTGFSPPELDIIFDESLTNKEVKLDKKINVVPFIPEDEIISKEGDIWQLGDHRIICGNSLDKSIYEKLLENKKADMIFTDPPYNVKVEGHVCGNGKYHHKEFAMASGEMSDNEFQDFLTKNFTLLKEFSKGGSLHYICMDWRHIKEIILAGSIFDEFENLCIWNKSNGGRVHQKGNLLIIDSDDKVVPMHNPYLINAIVKSHYWNHLLVNGHVKNVSEIQKLEGMKDPTYIKNVMKLKFIPAELTEQILNGTQPIEMTVQKLLASYCPSI